jgi:hypothetical protein
MGPRIRLLVGTGLLLALPCPGLASGKVLRKSATACRLVSLIDLSPTFRSEVTDAACLFVGRVIRATPPNPRAPGLAGVTDVVLEKVIKPNPALNQKVLTVGRYIRTDTPKQRFLLFADVCKGKVEPYRGIPLPAGSALAKYVEGILKVKDEKPATRLRFYFQYLGHRDPEIALDALKEFRRVDYSVLREVAEKLPDHRLAAWLADPKVLRLAKPLLSLLLGHCSKDRVRHARLLRTVLANYVGDFRGDFPSDPILCGLVMLQPKEGWQDVRTILEDPAQEFWRCYHALRVVRFLMEKRPDLMAQKKLLAALQKTLDQTDIVDLVIEDLRRWKRWEFTSRILYQGSLPTHDLRIIQRAVLRFALASPGPEARVYVEHQRRLNPEHVKEVEELLKLEGKP